MVGLRMSCVVLLITLLTSITAGCGASRRSLADLLLLHPPPQTLDRSGLQRRFLSVHDLEIEICIAQSPGAIGSGKSAAFVLEFTGNGNTAQEITRWVADGIWKDHPVEVWAVNYPGYGGSSGAARLSSIPLVALAAYDELKRIAGDRPIFVSGASLGGMTALFLAARRDVAGVLVLNPPPLREVVLGEHGWWNLWILAGIVAAEIPRDLDAVANATRCKAPVFAVVSERDEVVPARLQQRIYDRYAGPKQIVRMPGATHGSNVSPEATRAREAWIDDIWQHRVRPR